MNFKPVGTKYIHKVALFSYGNNYWDWSQTFDASTIGMLSWEHSPANTHEKINKFMKEMKVCIIYSIL